MATSAATPSGIGWVAFVGRIARSTLTHFVLAPEGRPDVEISIHKEDVQLRDARNGEPGAIMLRLGSTRVAITVLDPAAYAALPSSSGRASELCANGSECISNLEYCCGSAIPVGHCDGDWRC